MFVIRCEKHPTYTGQRKPTVPCDYCRALFHWSGLRSVKMGTTAALRVFVEVIHRAS